MDKESLITYISKLNDRNLQRQQSSGFTIWAILGVFAYLILDLSGKVPLVYKSPELIQYLVIFFAGLINLFVLIFLLIFPILLNSVSSGARRIFSNTSAAYILPVSYILFLFSYIDIKAASMVTKVNMPSMIFWIFAIFFAINGLIPLVQIPIRFIKSRKAKTYYPEISPFTPKIRIILSVIYTIVSIIGLLFLYITYRDIYISIEPTQISLLLKISIEMLGFFILIIAFLKVIESSNRFAWLENLEREIYLDNLSETEIEERLEKDYIGYNIFKWITKREQLLVIKSNELLDLFEEGKPKIEEIGKIDSKFQHEITGRRDDICNMIKIKLDEYILLVEETVFQLKEITKQGLPDKEEMAKIKNIQRIWGEQLEDIKTNQNNFCNYCQQACNCETTMI